MENDYTKIMGFSQILFEHTPVCTLTEEIYIDEHTSVYLQLQTVQTPQPTSQRKPSFCLFVPASNRNVYLLINI